jgi:ATP-binding cassette subfamily B protein
MKTARSQNIPGSPFPYVFFLSKKYRFLAAGVFLMITFGCVLGTGNNYVFKKIIDSINAPGDLWLWGVVYALVFFFSAISWRMSGMLGMRWMVRACSDSYALLFGHLINHSSNYFDNRFAGSITSKVSNASEGVRRITSILCWNLYPVLVNILASLVLAATVSYRFALILIIWAVVFISFNVFAVSKKQKYSMAYANSVSALRGQMVDITTNVKAVSHYSRKSHELSRLQEYIAARTKSHMKNWWMGEWMLATNNFLQFLFVIVMLLLALWLNQYQGLSIGNTIMIITLSASLKDQLMWIGNHLNDLMDYYGEVKDGLNEILIDHELKDRENALTLAVENAGLNFRQVSFRYGENYIFQDFNLQVAPGQKIGLVGESGAGKTTLVGMLLRQHDLSSGEILINDHNIAHVTQDSLRSSIAIVPQEPMLFHRSIMENIRYGNLQASDEQVMEAARLAQAHEFILELCHGYQTMVGERGVKLSGGQRQRIAIARAILKNAPVLILDEATSALDSKSEGEIQKALQNLMKDKTVIAIAHRLSTIKAMDRIIVIEKGRIIQDGSHTELLQEKDGNYQKLWQKQSEGFI